MNLLIVILSFISVFSQGTLETPSDNKSSKAVLWNKEKKLSWSDFKGSPKPGSHYAAECNWEINYSYSYNPGKSQKLQFEVNCYFDAAKSWVKSKDKSEGLLQHEQLHFDIAELCSRNLRKRLSDADFDKATFKEEINAIFKDILEDCDSIQNAYDEETNHGLIKSKQYAWQKTVNKEIIALNAYEHNIQTLDSPFKEQNIITRLFKKFNIF